MAYAAFADVQARAGRFGTIFTVSGKRPNQTDVEAFLDDCSAEIDAALASRGFGTPVTGAAAAALVDLAAYGALGRGLAGYPEDAVLKNLAAKAERIWVAALGDSTSTQREAILGSIRIGSHPVVALLEGESGSSAPSASCFWEDEPEYGSEASAQAELARLRLEPADAPVFAKLQSL